MTTTDTDALTERIGRILNDEGTWFEWTVGEWLEHCAAEYETGGCDEHR